MAKVYLEKVCKNFGKIEAVKDFTLEVEDQEFLVLLGPSGCGKSTTLRMIAGLEELTAGNIYIRDEIVNRIPPRNRDIAMVFQDYALYPHMTVHQNMGFGLKLRRVPKSEIDRRVREAAEILGIFELLHRKPRELSGGQRQRVAVGRAIVRKPAVFLFDEPLSNLDAKLRVQMRAELSKLHDQLKTTIVYVTHDQVEAMTMGTKIVIMKEGLIQQIGSPMEVYTYPINLFVAGFIGSPAMNFLPARITGKGGRLVVESAGFQLPLAAEQAPHLERHMGEEMTLGVRPENLQDASLVEQSTNLGIIKGSVEVVEPLGAEVLLNVDIAGHALTARVGPNTAAKRHQAIDLAIQMNKVCFFEKEEPCTRIKTEAAAPPYRTRS